MAGQGLHHRALFQSIESLVDASGEVLVVRLWLNLQKNKMKVENQELLADPLHKERELSL